MDRMKITTRKDRFIPTKKNLSRRARQYSFLLFLFSSLSISVPAYAADCTAPAGPEGEILYNSDYRVPQVCINGLWVAMGAINPAAGGAGCTTPAAPEGQILYNQDNHVLQYCDGDDWIQAVGASMGGCTPDPACPNVGDVCSGDASGGGNPKFAGCITYYDANSADVGVTKAIYVTQANQSTASQWKNATGTDDISTDSTEDGKINSANRGGVLSDFPAFELCENLTDGGYTDWYLPARTELDLLWRNAATITGFTTSGYWSSTEYDTSNAWYQLFSVGSQNGNNKTFNFGVRCVRRD
ncbi:MAG: DUF1566 domain-containing protein [Porticoccaceae bacterium]